MARSYGISRIRGLKRGLGDDGLDWSDIITTGITSAATVAKAAVSPTPTYAYTSGPQGTQILSYGAPGSSVSPYSYSPYTSGLGDISQLFSSPIVLIGGIGLIAVLLLKR